MLLCYSLPKEKFSWGFSSSHLFYEDRQLLYVMTNTERPGVSNMSLLYSALRTVLFYCWFHWSIAFISPQRLYIPPNVTNRNSFAVSYRESWFSGFSNWLITLLILSLLFVDLHWSTLHKDCVMLISILTF